MADKVKTSDIIAQLSKQCNVSQQEATLFVDSLQAIFTKAITEDKILKINNLGTFKSELTKPRKSIDINTGKSIEIAPHYRITFTPSVALANAVNADLSHLETIDLDIVDNTSEETEITDNRSLTSQETPENKLHTAVEAKISTTADMNDTTGSTPDEPIDKLSEDALGIQQLLNEIQGLDNMINGKANQVAEHGEQGGADATTDAKAQDTDREQTDDIKESANTETLTGTASETVGTSEMGTSHQNTEEQPQAAAPKTYTAPATNAIDGAAAVAAINKENDKHIGGSQAIWISIATILSLLIVGIIVWNNIDFFQNSEPTPKAIIAEADTTDTFDTFDNEIEYADPMSGTAHNHPTEEEAENGASDIAAEPESPTPLQAETSEPQNKAQLATQDTPPLPEPEIMADEDIYSKQRIYTEYIDTVTLNEGSRLTLIALRQYGHKAFWIYIYEANRDKISNPNDVKSGTILRIPQVDQRLIDPNNSGSVRYAQELGKRYSQQR